MLLILVKELEKFTGVELRLCLSGLQQGA